MKAVFKVLIVMSFLLVSNYIFSQKFTPVENIPEGKALIYIYRPGKFVGGAAHYTVNANDEKVSEKHLRNNTYLVYFAEPGKYHFWARSGGTKRDVHIEVEANKTYYVRGTCCKFSIPDLEKAKKEIIKCKVPKK